MKIKEVTMKRNMMCAAMLALLLAPAAGAQAGDVKGAKDAPGIGRFAGSTIIGYSHKKFDEYLLPAGKVIRDEKDAFKYEKSKTVEGEVTRILYLASKDASVAEVFRNYERNLKRKGFETIYSCKSSGNEPCGSWMAGMKNFQPELASHAYNFMGENRYISMVKRDPKGDEYVSLLVYDYGFDYYTDRYRHPMAQLDVIRAEPLDDSQIQVLAAKALSGAIAETGHVALHGIYFDTDSAVLKPESKAALNEIGKLLGQEPGLKLFVVGHTDNTGAFAHNMDLSKRRAAAVAVALAKAYGVAQDRLSAHGVGQLAPVAPNTTEEGRARNRRVELVRQ